MIFQVPLAIGDFQVDLISDIFLSSTQLIKYLIDTLLLDQDIAINIHFVKLRNCRDFKMN